MRQSEGFLQPGVLILAHAFPPENIVGALRPGRFAKYLPENGFRVHVLTASRQQETTVGVHWVPDRSLTGQSFGARLLRRIRAIAIRSVYPGAEGQSFLWLAKALRVASRVIAREQLTFLVSTFPPLTTHLAALWLKRRNPRLWWIADFRDPLIGNPVATGRADTLNRYIELAIFSNADVLVANTDAVAARWRAIYPQYRKKITHIWNGFDPEETIGPLAIPPRHFRQLAHVGEIYGGRHPGVLLDALLRLRRSLAQMPPFKLELIGEIDRGTLPNAAVLTALERDGLVVVSPPAHSSSNAAQIMAEADALLLIDWAGYSAGLQVPSKLYVYLRIGRPILAITTKDSPVDRILHQSAFAFACLYPNDSEAQIDAKILAFLSLPNEARHSSPWFFENFDGRHQVATLARLLRPTDNASPAAALRG